MKKIRAILVGPYPKPYGGIASLIVNLSIGLKNHNIEDLAIISFGKENKVEHFKDFTLYRINLMKNVYQLINPTNIILIFRSFFALSGFKLNIKSKLKFVLKSILINQILIHQKSNLVNFYQSDNSIEILSLKKLWGKKVTIILKIFGEIYTPGTRNFILKRKKLFTKLLSLPDSISATSEYCSHSFKQINIDRKVEVIYVGVDLKKYSNLQEERKIFRQQNSISEHQTLFLFLGRFHKEMGLDSFLKMIPLVIEKNSDVRFIIGGAKGPLDSLAHHYAELYKDFVILKKDIPFSELPILYSSSDIVCAPSSDQRACMGVSIKEAMASSKPVIATKSGGIAEAVLDEETGYLIPHLTNGTIDIKRFASKMILLSKNSLDREAFGKNARLICEDKFSNQETLLKTANLFRKSIDVKKV